MYEIYILTNIINAKQYIGITNNLKNRWRSHKKANGNQVIHHAIKKHGLDNFVFTHFATAFDDESAKIIEKMLIIEHNTKFPNGYNLTDGGDGVIGYKPTIEQRKNRSTKMIGKWADKDYNIKMSKSFQGRWSNNEKEKQSNRIQKFWNSKDQSYLKIHAENIKSGWTDEKRKKQSEISFAYQSKPEIKLAKSEKTKSLWNNLEYREKQSAARKAAWAIRKAKNSSETGEIV